MADQGAVASPYTTAQGYPSLPAGAFLVSRQVSQLPLLAYFVLGLAYEAMAFLSTSSLSSACDTRPDACQEDQRSAHQHVHLPAYRPNRRYVN